MRRSTRGSLIGLVAVLALFATTGGGCPKKEGGSTSTATPAATATSKAGSSPKPSAAPSASALDHKDLVINGLSVVKVFAAAGKDLGTMIVVEIVPKGKQSEKCTSGFVVDGSATGTDGFFPCDDGHIAVAGFVADTLADQPPIATWYVVAYNASRFNGYTEGAPAVCAAGFIIAGSPDFGRITQQAAIAFVLDRQGTNAAEPLNKGIKLRQNHGKIGDCK